MEILDYIYVDLPKVVSIYSQITGGVVEYFESTQEQSAISDNKRKYDFKIFKHDAGGTSGEKSELKEVVKPHHALFSELEETLSSNNQLVDLSTLSVGESLRSSKVRALLRDRLFLKVTGRAVIEDYDRIQHVASTFPKITKFINRCAQSTIEKSDAFLEVKDQIDALKQQAKQVKDRNQKAKQQSTIDQLEGRLKSFLVDSKAVEEIDEWLLDGVKDWMQTFLPHITNLRIYPNAEHPDEQVFGHLKSDAFEDPESTSFHFTYGSKPTEKLSMLALVTSVPSEHEDDFKPLEEFERDELSNNEAVERGIRGLFRGFDSLESMIRTCRYPRVLVQPLIVYRQAQTKS